MDIIVTNLIKRYLIITKKLIGTIFNNRLIEILIKEILNKEIEFNL